MTSASIETTLDGRDMISLILAAARRLRPLFAALLFMQCASIPPAFAWGDAGHRIVCEIAHRELKPAAKAQVDALMANDPKFHTFAEGCTWPDVFPPVRPGEHFLNVPRSAHAVDPAKLCFGALQCVASAILDDARDLALSTDDNDRLRLLKSLCHWVGDIHQPFHVSFEDDKGGNLIDSTGLCAYSLHLAWDICIIEKKIGHDAGAIATELESEISDADRRAWASQVLEATAVASWANESFSLVTRPSVQYCIEHNEACWYSPDEPQFAGKRRVVEVDARYLDEQAPVVRDRLKRAGVRLAAILNTIFSN
jgi:nuclease S1